MSLIIYKQHSIRLQSYNLL